jgi:peptidoglycan endopeptidase LytE
MGIARKARGGLRYIVIGLSLIVVGCATRPSAAAPARGKEGRPSAVEAAGDNPLRRVLLDKARGRLGDPYVYSGRAPGGFDCSGFISYVYKTAAKMELPPVSNALGTMGETIAFEEARPGDVLVFSAKPGGRVIDHTAILYEKSPEGTLYGSKVIHAVSAGPRTGVITGTLGNSRGTEYFFQRYMYTKRFLED